MPSRAPTPTAKHRGRVRLTAARAGTPKRKLASRAEAPDRLPAWAESTLFKHAKIAAWEGTASPLRATLLHPKHGSFLDDISLSRSGEFVLWEKSIHPLDQARVRRKLSEIVEFPSEVDYRLVSNSGAIIWVRHLVIEAKSSNGRRLLRGFVRDMQCEKELELESLRVSEREQNRIGQDLHDDLCQVLAGVSCLMRVLEDRIVEKAPEEVPNLKELNQQIVDAMLRTRALTHGLFPGKIQIADVRGALLELAAQIRTRFQVEVVTEFVGRFPQHTPAQIIQIYRLAQEAMSNSLRHGHATRIVVRLEAQKKMMALSIVDNGTGLSHSEASEKGVGLHIMEYRTRTLGGELDVRNSSHGGVVVELRYPFES